MNKIALILALAASLVASGATADETKGGKTNVSVVFDQELPNVPGKSLRVVLVDYAPGGSNPSHHHPASAFIYARVLKGEIRSKVNDEPERTYKAGEGWTEKPGDHHKVSANASSTKPARLMAIFVLDTKEKGIVFPDN
jgi:quercetin dioxygenase-like cupin family protein